MTRSFPSGSSPRRATAILVVALAAALSSASPAQEGSLEQLRAEFLEEVARRTLPQELSYITRLGQLEEGLCGRKDYEGARAVAREIEDARVRIASLRASQAKNGSATPDSGGSGSGSGRIVFAVEKADCSDGVTLDGDAGALIGFVNAEASAVWDLPKNLPEGGYEVVLNYSSGSARGGRLRVSEGFHYLSTEIRPTGGDTTVLSANIGTLRVRSKPTALTLSGEGTGTGAPLLRLRSITLIPASLDSP